MSCISLAQRYRLRKREVERIGVWLGLLLASGFPVWVAYHHQLLLNDDTYITLTYAKSIAAGRGFVFNHPPATLGTTTPLFTLVVAGLAWILPDLEVSRIAVAVSAACWAGIPWLIYIARDSLDLSEWNAITVGSVIAGSGWVGFLAMEAYPFAFLLVLALILFLEERWFWSGVVAGLLFLTRGEGILLLPILLAYSVGHEWAQRERPSLQVDGSVIALIAGCSVVLLIWFSYASLTFGRVLPNTLSAKVAQRAAGHWRSFPNRLLREWLPTWETQLALPGHPSLSLWWLLAIVGLGVVFLHKRQWLIPMLWVAAYIVGYTALGVAGYWWYQLPILFGLQLLVGLGLSATQEVSATLGGRWRGVGRAASTVLTVIVVVLLVRPRVRAIRQGVGDSRAASYLRLADWINKHTNPSQSVAYVEIGYLGYYTDNPVVDLMGLVTPDITPHIAEGDFSSGFWAYKPDYFVYLADFNWALGSICRDNRFEQTYRPITTLPGPRDAELVIYERVEASG